MMLRFYEFGFYASLAMTIMGLYDRDRIMATFISKHKSSSVTALELDTFGSNATNTYSQDNLVTSSMLLLLAPLSSFSMALRRGKFGRQLESDLLASQS